ncbi:septal ring lytic transglycosylase RlpA family protein [Avibacterium sp. 21-586]|uniref:septal ring lytic transglycosylase RlpA family protein n=1 Tax=Avibacterium sp. 21-586 TaxID=2911534 RepID=UPI00224752FE|nr:septal ring lytic transglycosylase RlpA family protein [Avibacterium sp. 21-586]MCW9710663.1 septal ring lytic transglycosylase RlpA family protein [Avibacterium sp. 21-586]
MKMKFTFLLKLSATLIFLVASINSQAETHKLYGIKGATLTHKPVTEKNYSYVVRGVTYTTKHKKEAKHYRKEGIASYYHTMFAGRKTSNGEYYNPNSYTAAHKTLPLNSYVLVTNLRNGKKVVVRINDRGPFVKGRIIDLSRKAAGELGIVHRGLGKVRVEAMYVDRNGKISGAGATSLAKMAKTKEALKRLETSSNGSQEKSAVNSHKIYSGYQLRMLDLSKSQAVEIVKKAKKMNINAQMISHKKKYEVRFREIKTKKQAQILKSKLHRLNRTKPIIISSYKN